MRFVQPFQEMKFGWEKSLLSVGYSLVICKVRVWWDDKTEMLNMNSENMIVNEKMIYKFNAITETMKTPILDDN